MNVAIADTQSDMNTVHWRINRLLAAMLAVVVVLVLKRHYSLAGPDQLTWILSPTARLIAWLTGADPMWEAGVGYADFNRGIIIVPACAGINFMIMAFGLAVFCALGRLQRFTVLFAWMVASLAGAYVLTLGINTLRIAVSMALYQADIYGAWITPERLHRLVGVWIYLGALGLFFKGLQPHNRCPGGSFRPALPGRAGHLAGMAAPFVVSDRGRRGYRRQTWFSGIHLPAFGRHGLTVVAAAVALWGGTGLVKLFVRYLNGNRLNGKDTDRGG